MMRRILAATAAGIAAALIMGVVMTAYFRALMALIAESDLMRDPAHFSLTSTAGIAGIVVVFGIPGAIALAALRRRRWIGYALAAAGTWPHIMMLAGELSTLAYEGDVDRTAALVIGYAAYVIALVVLVWGTGRLAPWLRGGFKRRPAPSPAAV